MVVMKLKDNIIHLCVQRDDEDDGEDKVQRDHPSLEIKDHHGDGQDKKQSTSLFDCQTFVKSFTLMYLVHIDCPLLWVTRVMLLP